MTWIDWTLIGIIVLSTIISLIRGFTREVFSIITWVVAVIIAIKFTPALALWLTEHIGSDELRLIAAFAALFLATIFIGSLINYGIGRLVNSSGLSGTDRLLGSIFGVARGVLVGVLLIIAAGLTPVVNQPVWQETRLIPLLQPVTDWLLGYVPHEATISWLKEVNKSTALEAPPKTAEPTPPKEIGIAHKPATTQL